MILKLIVQHFIWIPIYSYKYPPTYILYKKQRCYINRDVFLRYIYCFWFTAIWKCKKKKLLNFQKTILEGWNNSNSNGGYKWNSVHSLAWRQPGKQVQADFVTMRKKRNQLIFILKYTLPLMLEAPFHPSSKRVAFLSSQ